MVVLISDACGEVQAVEGLVVGLEVSGQVPGGEVAIAVNFGIHHIIHTDYAGSCNQSDFIHLTLELIFTVVQPAVVTLVAGVIIMDIEVSGENFVPVSALVEVLQVGVYHEAQTSFGIVDRAGAWLECHCGIISPDKETAAAPEVDIGIQSDGQAVVNPVAQVGRDASVAAVCILVIAVAV